MNFKKIKEELLKFSKDVAESVSVDLATNQPQLQISDMVVGGKVEIVNADGSLSPAPDGEYTHAKDVLVVKKGQIVSINGDKTSEAPAAMDSADSAPASGNEDLAAQVKALQEQTQAMQNTIDELKQAMADDKASEQGMSATFTKQIQELNETLKVIATTPAEFSKTNEKAVVKDDKDFKVEAAVKLWGNRK